MPIVVMLIYESKFPGMTIPATSLKSNERRFNPKLDDFLILPEMY